MTWNGRAPGTSARTMSTDCWSKWTLLVQGATKSLSSMSRSTWPPDSWHERSSIAFAALCLHLHWKRWEASFSWRRASSRAAGCVAHALPVGRELFSVLVASGSMSGCSGEVRARGHVVPSVGRGGCCRSARTPFAGASLAVSQPWWRWELPSARVLLFSTCGWRSLGGIRVLKLHGKFTGTERGTSFSHKHMCPSLFNSRMYQN